MPEVDLPDDFFTLVEGKGNICSVAFCRNRKAKGARICYKHRMEKWRAANPMRSSYCTLRDHAKCRRLAFTITFEDYREICETTRYLDEKGNEKDCLQLDRIDPLRGYEPGNIEVITCSENTAKGNKERWGDEYRKEILRRKGYIVEEEDEWIDPDSVEYSDHEEDDNLPF